MKYKINLIGEGSTFMQAKRTDGTFTHTVKEWPCHFKELVLSERGFELRRDDRGYCAGDFIVIKEFEPAGDDGHFTGRQVQRQIQRVYHSGDLPGIMPGFVALQLSKGFYC
jgi:hypothetical protein